MNKRETLPQILFDNCGRYGDRKVALRKKQYGIWNEYTWKGYYEKVKYFSLGLMELGFEPGDVIAIVGDTDPEWFIGELAAQAVGGIGVGLYSDGMPEELKYIIIHSESRFIMAKDQEQVDKILHIKNDIVDLRKIIYWEDNGLWDYRDSLLMSFEQVENIGREYEEAHPGFFEKQVKKGKRSDTAVLSYTSGTTGLPKGVMITHENILFLSRTLKGEVSLEHTNYVAFTTPAWVWEQWAGIAVGLDMPLIVHFPEEPETVQENIREVGPYFVMMGPRQLESLARMTRVKIHDTSWLKKILFNSGISIGNKVAGLKEEGRVVNWHLRTLNWLAQLMVLEPLRDKLGLSHTKYLNTGSASLSPDVLRFFHALGIVPFTTYGTTEVGLISRVRVNDLAFDTVGNVNPNCEIRISNDGEILTRGDNLFEGYYKDAEATASKVVNGWFYTGDAGSFDPEGRLVFWDRVDELMDLGEGHKFAPQYAETRLRFSSYVKDAFVLGNAARGYVTTIINIDFDNVVKWAEDHRLLFTTMVDLSQREEIRALIKSEVDIVNRPLPEFARIKKFVNLHKDFDADEAELTRSRKLRRSVMGERYADLIDAMYLDKESFRMEAPVTYKDGRKGVVAAEIFVNQPA